MYLSLAAIYVNLVVFRLLLFIHTISFLITNFSNSILYYSSGWYPDDYGPIRKKWEVFCDIKLLFLPLDFLLKDSFQLELL